MWPVPTDFEDLTRVHVTSADGLHGSHLTDRLRAADVEVTELNAFDACGSPDTLPSQILARIRVEWGDKQDPAFMTRFCKGQRLRFHRAAPISILLPSM